MRKERSPNHRFPGKLLCIGILAALFILWIWSYQHQLRLLSFPVDQDHCGHRFRHSHSFTPFELHPKQCESPLLLESTRDAFHRIYKNGMWFNNKPIRQPVDLFYGNAEWPPSEKSSRFSASGGGSARGSATIHSLAIIVDTIHKYNVSSMIDVPCGDVNWIFDNYFTDTLPVYIGLDITSDVIEVNAIRFQHHVNKHFRFWDATICQFPKFRGVAIKEKEGTDDDYEKVENEEYKSVDLIHVRDVIQHLSLEQGVHFFCNVFCYGARVLVTTSYMNATQNRNIGEGDWYENNLHLEPFSFPESDNCVQTHPDIEPDYTCVYNLTEDWIPRFVAEKCSPCSPG